jgi:pyruvate dehydrogenase E2 component (dihydrolipoamide acetyltransferase)
MATAVEAPKLGNSVEECVVTKWVKRAGDKVNAGELVVEIETDKATFELNSPVDGTILETFFEEGALVPVFVNLFAVGEPGENVDALRPQSAANGAAKLEAKRESGPVEVAAAAPAVSAPTRAQQPAGAMSPRARRFAEEHDFQPGPIAGSGPAGRVLEQDVRDAYFSTPRVSPAARRQVQEGMHAPGQGTGAGGMILSSDLGSAVTATRLSSMREKIARRMRESLSSTAQYTLHASAEATGLQVLRARIKASPALPPININDLVTFCTIRALLQVPDLNAWLSGGEMRKFSEVHMGFATDTPKGLLVPVVRNADKLAIGDLAIRMKALASDAVKGSLSPDDMSGATFTISNLGGLGIERFTPLLNPPQVAILGVGAIEVKPVRKDGKLEFIDAIGLSLTCDHQVIDGAPGARFLQVLKREIENVETACTI